LAACPHYTHLVTCWSLAMTPADPHTSARWLDLKGAWTFAQQALRQWYQEGKLRKDQMQTLWSWYTDRLEDGARAVAAGQPLPAAPDLPEASPGESSAEQTQRYWMFL